MLKEFREFAMRGNVIDLAFGVIIGAAFTGIVNSLVNDVIMPPIGFITGGLDFSNLFVVIKHGHTADAVYATVAQAKNDGAVTINYGIFINAVINFLIVAFVLFLMVKQINRLKRKEAAGEAPPPPPTRTEVLLAEIRDELKSKI